MAGARGYSSYRGRGAKWKILLAALLILIILAALAVLYLQQHIVYDEDGRPWIDFPWAQEQTSDVPPEKAPSEVELIVQEPEPPPSALTLSLSDAPLTMASWFTWLDGTQNSDCRAVVITLKDSGSQIYFDAEGAVSRTVKTEDDTAAALAAMTAQEELRTIARFSCFLDGRAANSNVRAMGLRNTGGYIFYDGNNNQWLDPSKPAAREYLCALAVQIAELGFDELLLTDLSYPTEGKINKIDYNGDGPIENNLTLFLTELKAALAPYEITLSLELPETVVFSGADEVSGQTLSLLAPLVGKIYAVTEPGRVENLAAAVTQAGGEEVSFIPELAADDASLTGERLLLPQE